MHLLFVHVYTPLDRVVRRFLFASQMFAIRVNLFADRVKKGHLKTNQMNILCRNAHKWASKNIHKAAFMHTADERKQLH